MNEDLGHLVKDMDAVAMFVAYKLKARPAAVCQRIAQRVPGGLYGTVGAVKAHARILALSKSRQARLRNIGAVECTAELIVWLQIAGRLDWIDAQPLELAMSRFAALCLRALRPPMAVWQGRAGRCCDGGSRSIIDGPHPAERQERIAMYARAGYFHMGYTLDMMNMAAEIPPE